MVSSPGSPGVALTVTLGAGMLGSDDLLRAAMFIEVVWWSEEDTGEGTMTL